MCRNRTSIVPLIFYLLSVLSSSNRVKTFTVLLLQIAISHIKVDLSYRIWTGRQPHTCVEFRRHFSIYETKWRIETVTVRNANYHQLTLTKPLHNTLMVIL